VRAGGGGDARRRSRRARRHHRERARARNRHRRAPGRPAGGRPYRRGAGLGRGRGVSAGERPPRGGDRDARRAALAVRARDAPAAAPLPHPQRGDRGAVARGGGGRGRGAERLAAELGREVLAVPGRVTAAESRGANRLIQDGAALALGWEDVVAALPEKWKACLDTSGRIESGPERSAAREGAAARGSAASRRVLALLGEDPIEIDHVIERSGLGAGPVSAALLDLELEGR